MTAFTICRSPKVSRDTRRHIITIALGVSMMFAAACVTEAEPEIAKTSAQETARRVTVDDAPDCERACAVLDGSCDDPNAYDRELRADCLDACGRGVIDRDLTSCLAIAGCSAAADDCFASGGQ